VSVARALHIQKFKVAAALKLLTFIGEAPYSNVGMEQRLVALRMSTFLSVLEKNCTQSYRIFR
jgi:hypothetical protein